jgi:RNA polymerase sigma-70 factor, ECF subfamily
VLVEVHEFEEFFELMRPRLMRSAMRVLDVDTANEVAISTLHTVWTKNLPTPRTDGEEVQLQALTFRILDGHVRNAQRAQARRARLHDSVAEQQTTARTTEPDVAQRLEEQAAQQDVQDLLDDLPASEREVVVLVLDGFRVNEIAELLGRRPAAISMRLNRARKRLADALERRDDDRRR